jgi:hypothetical protein
MLVMDARQLHPDPVDYQLMAFSNFCQLLSCVCDLLACFCEELQDLAQIIDCCADLITCSVVGCMGAQLEHELKQAEGMSGPMANQMVRNEPTYQHSY